MTTRLPSPSVAIHQPNFLPWAGWFAKALAVDEMILLDDADFPKHSWVNRVRLCGDARPFWLTVPVHVRLGQSIDRVEIADGRWARRACRSLDVCYGRAPWYDHFRDELQRLLTQPTGSLLELNLALLEYLLQALGARCRLTLSSSLNAPGRGSERLARLVEARGGRSYLSGRGGNAYQNPQDFSRTGIELVTLHLQEDPYPRCGKFWYPGLSIVDLLVHRGPETADWLRRASHFVPAQTAEKDRKSSKYA